MSCSCLTPYSEDVLGLAAALYPDMRLLQTDGRCYVGVYKKGACIFNVSLTRTYRTVDDAINSQEFSEAFSEAADAYLKASEAMERRFA